MPLPLRNVTIFFAGLFGLAGVALAASASHGEDVRLLGSASTMCLAHAPALIGLYAVWSSLRTAPVAAVLIVLGTLLFVADLMVRHVFDHGLFPMSAPLGGLLMMAGWLAIAVGATFKPGA